MKLIDRVLKLEQDVETITRSVSLKLPKEVHELLNKNGYYQTVILPSTDERERVSMQAQLLNDRLRITFEIAGRYRVIQYDFYYE
jgi:hypothetical protein